MLLSVALARSMGFYGGQRSTHPFLPGGSRMRSRLPAIVAVALLVALSIPAVVSAGSAKSAAQAEHERIIAYWTPARIAAAQPRDFVKTVVGFTRAPSPKARPGGGGNVTGASWGGTSQDIIRKQSGRILFTMDGGQWICSGSVINTTSSTQSVVLTAGHCVNEGSSWASNLMYIPDFDEGPDYTCNSAGQVFGCWTATRVAAHRDFVNGGGFGNDTVDVDYGFALFGSGGKANADLEATVGAYGLKTTATALNVQQWAFGYPAAGKYKGKDLVYCTNATASLIEDPYGADTWGMNCNMTGGSSGGPWVTGTTSPGTNEGTASSVNSYGYNGLTYMFGPKFDGDTTSVYNAIVAGSSNTVGIVH
jgi:hypothetical protein